MLYISAFTFGGGFVIVTLMKKKFVDDYGWLGEQEMLDITSIAQSTPGAIAVNAAVIVGKKLGGTAGIIAATLGTVIPPIVIITVISFFYNAFAENRYVALVLRGMQAGVAAVILDVVYSLSSGYFKNRKVFEIILIAISFVLVFFFKVNVIIIILAAALIGLVAVLVRKRKAVKK
ncbi:MAG: chromate transporter [Clostridia bacterium]|nr:chromate transporter [Clostridia bacterium]